MCPIVLLHPGSVYQGEPIPLLRALELLSREERMRDRLSFRFIGYMHPRDRAHRARSPLADRFLLQEDRVPHPEAVWLTRRSHVLLRLLQRSPNANSGKVFEYMVAGRPVLEEPRPAFDGHVLLWCLETYVPLLQFRPGEIHLVFYERLCREPQQELERLFSFLGKEMRASIIDELGKPSAVSRSDSAVCTGASLVEGWRDHVNQEQVDRAMELLRAFGLEGLYADAAMPNVEAASEFMESRTCAG